MTLEYQISLKDENKTIKDILKNKLNISNRLITKLKLNQKIFIDNKVAMINEVPDISSKIIVDIDFVEEDNTVPQEGNIDILYEDEYFLAVNKPANMVVHPCSYHPDHTLANYVKYYLGNNRKVRPINRIDNGTSGIVLFAKNEYIQEAFKNLNEKPLKEYLAIVYGVFNEKKGTISYPIARKANSIIEREVNVEAGQEAITHYKVIAEGEIEGEKISLLKVLIDTGRTHQIRVHMSYLGHPLVGDTLYNNFQIDTYLKVLDRQALHAYKLQFKHPITNKIIKIVAEAPVDLCNIVKECIDTSGHNVI